MYGMHVHEAVIAAGEKESGVTVHMVNAEYDKGPIVAQRAVPVLDGDTPESLQKRVLAEEHRALCGHDTRAWRMVPYESPTEGRQGRWSDRVHVASLRSDCYFVTYIRKKHTEAFPPTRLERT